MADVRIVMTAPGQGEVFVDGVKIERVTAVEFRAAVGCENAVVLTLNASTVEIEGPADVVVTGEADG